MQIGGALLLTLARVQGLIEADTATRGVMVLIGLSLAVWGNLMPKMLEVPQRTVSEATVSQSVQRFAGWAMMIAGLLWAVLWGFAPQEIANPAGIAIMATSAVATMSYTVWRHRKSRLSGRE
jgi:hypothetical protein